MNTHPHRVRYRRRGWLAQLAALAVCATMLLSAAPAVAGHYYIRDLDLYSHEQIVKLRDTGIQTTEHFLAAAQTAEARQTLAEKVNIDEQEVLRFAKDCELLQIDGVGPKVVKLFREAGVTSVDDLASRKAPDLHNRLIAVNKQKKITGVDPPVDLVAAWIKAASKVKYRVK